MIKKVLSKMLLSIMLFVFLFTNTSIAAVIITSEKSTDNDEADQQIEIDAKTDATAEQEGEEVATIKQKIEKELETQMKEGIAENAKSKINTQIYINESTILGDIGRAWKEVVKTEITDERAERIYTVYVENLEEYAGKKIDAWINEYYTNNKDKIVTKVNKYIDDDESMISTAVSTVVYTALDDFEEEMEKLVTETNGKIGSIVKDVLSQYEKISTWEEKAVEAICLEIPIQIGESLNNIFSQKFSWESEKLTEGLELIETSESVVSKEFSNKTINNVASQIAKAAGIDTSSGAGITEALIKYGGKLVDKEFVENWKLIDQIVIEKTLSSDQLEKYISGVQKNFAAKEKKLVNAANIKKQTANLIENELDRKKKIEEIEEQLEIDLAVAYRAASEEERAKLKQDAIDKYDAAMKELKEKMGKSVEEQMNDMGKNVQDAVHEFATGDVFKDLSIEKVLTKGQLTEVENDLQKQYDAIDVQYGAKISEEEQKKWDDEIAEANKKMQDSLEAIELKWPEDLTTAQKEERDRNATIIQADANAQRTTLAEKYGLKLSPEQETERNNRLSTVEKNYNESVDKIKKDYDEAIANAKTKEERNQLKEDRDSALDTAKSEYKREKREIKEEYEPTDLTPEQKSNFKQEDQKIDDAEEASLQENKDKYPKPELSDEEKQAKRQAIKNVKNDNEEEKEKINDSHKLPEQTDEQKAAAQEAKRVAKEEAEKKKKEIEDQLKEIRRQQKIEIKNIQEQTKQKQTEYNDWYDNTYKSEKDRLKDAIRNAKTQEEKTAAEKELANLETEKKKKKGELELARKDLREKELSLLSKEQQAIMKVISQLVSSAASQFANKIVGSITDKLNEWADKLGTIAGGVVKAITQQAGAWVVANITQNVVKLVESAFGLTANYEFTAFKIDWAGFAKSVLSAWAEDCPALAEILSGYGGIPIKVNATYEMTAMMNYVFLARSGLTLIPTAQYMTARKIARSFASSYKSDGDIGADGTDVFGTKERGGYNPLQFLPMGSFTLEATIPPYLILSPTWTSVQKEYTVTDHIPLPPIVLGGFYALNVTGGQMTPKYQLYTAPLIGPFWDTAYVAAEFANATGMDSYVQRAFSRTSLAQANASVAFEQTKYSAALVKEAKKYASFSQKVLSAGGYSNSLKDLTDEENLKTRYISDSDEFIVGPFKIDYIKSRVETEFRTTDIGFISSMKVYYMDTETNKQKELSKDSWQILFSEDGEADLDYSSERYSESYIYPYPKEEFYIAIDKSKNPDITNISKIQIKFKEMQVVLAGMVENLTYGLVYSVGKIAVSGFSFLRTITRHKVGRVHNIGSIYSVVYAKRYYMHHSMEILLNKKVIANPAYETSEYTTSATIKTEGIDGDAVVYGEETNSALYDSISSVLNTYTSENTEKYTATSSSFTKSVSKLSSIYASTDGDTKYLKAVEEILKSASENDAAKALKKLSTITGTADDDFQKVATITKYISEKQKVKELATLMETSVEIYKNTDDNLENEILNLLNETDTIYDNDDYSKIMATINKTINECEYKEAVFALLAQGELTNEEMDTYLKNKFTELNQDNRGLVRSTVRSISNTLNNTGDFGKYISEIIKKAYGLYNNSTTTSDLIQTIVDNSNDKELQKEYRTFTNLVQINKKVEEISKDETLSEEEKYKYKQEEEIKAFKVASVSAKELEKGKTEIEAIEKSYSETSNIEKQVFSKFQTIVKDLKAEEVEKLTKTLQKSTDIENTLEVINAELVRNNLKGESDKASTFVDILEENASLYDRTAYAQYDPNYNITKVERPENVYYMGDDKIDFTMTIAGVVWKDGHTGLQNDYDGVRMANSAGNIEIGVEGVKVTLINTKTNEIGRMKVNGSWTEAVTYTDEGGYYHFEEVEASKYYVQFTYDGQKYMATTALSDGEKTTKIREYEKYPDLEIHNNNSKATENEAERIAFNDKFYDIRENSAYSKDGQIINLQYEEKDGTSEIVTLDSAGHVLPQFAMTASTKELGITYPIDDAVTLDNETTETITSQYVDSKISVGEYKKTGEYMYHVNLGLVERSKLDLALTQDVYEVTTTVNEKQETYSYNERGILDIFDAKLKNAEVYKEYTYTRELYNADYQLRLEDYSTNSLNKLDRDGNDKSAEIEKIKEVKETAYENGSLEERAFVTYKITLKNQSMLQSAVINEITDYFDPTYNLVEEDIYQNVQNSEGIVENKLVAKQSYFIVESDNSATEYKLVWEETGMTNGLKAMNTVQTNDIGLEDVIINAQDEIYVFITFEIEKDANRAIQLGNKENIAEISSYTAIEIGENSKEHSIGLIDKDSAPDSISVGDRTTYEDDTDAAPVIEFKLYNTDLRNINGYVWNDNRDVELTTGQVVGNGIREENEELINGVRVQLIEIVRDPLTGAEYEYVWKEMYTGEDNYKHIGSTGGLGNTERGQTISTGSIISNTNLGAVQKGEYKFHNYIAGNFIVRYIYGDTYKTYLAKGSENSEGEGLNETSYNGQDYKSTAYLKGSNLNTKWYDLSGFDKEDKLYSDAKDDTTRRNKVIEYAETIQNDKAEILASFDERKDKYYYNRALHQTLRDNTWMFADTAKINVNIEYNTTKSNGADSLTYRIKNIDLGLEERPETKIELTKEIKNIKITLASGETIIDTEAGMSQNVNSTYNKRTEVKGNAYKRNNLRYEYREGKIHIYMDEEIMQGANIQITYKITVTNKSEIDYTGENGSLGYTYYTGQVSSSDKIVTTTVNKIIDYVDNSLTFRKVDNTDWSLIESMREFTTTNTGAQLEAEKMDYGTFIEKMMEEYGEDYVAKHLREFEASFKVYEETGKIQKIGSTGITGNTTKEEENDPATYLSNYQVIENMKDRTNSIGYLNEELSIVKTKSSKTTQEPITQIVVTKALENTKLKPGEQASVELTLSKTLSPNDEDDTLTYTNIAEILQYSNTAGRRDMDAIPGNQEPDEDSYEYDSDFTEKILITPPTGENRAFYFVLATVVLVVLAGGIIIIKRKVIDKK